MTLAAAPVVTQTVVHYTTWWQTVLISGVSGLIVGALSLGGLIITGRSQRNAQTRQHATEIDKLQEVARHEQAKEGRAALAAYLGVISAAALRLEKQGFEIGREDVVREVYQSGASVDLLCSSVIAGETTILTQYLLRISGQPTQANQLHMSLFNQQYAKVQNLARQELGLGPLPEFSL